MNPWLALSTYEEKDANVFYGREYDTSALLSMIMQNEYVVCYAASGDGKSSLINAGLCPKLRKLGYIPIRISFTTNEYNGINIPKLPNDEHIDFDRLISEKINQKLQENECFYKTNNKIDNFNIGFEPLSKYAAKQLPDNLWWKLRTHSIQLTFGEIDYQPILIFDQFEEILHASWKNDFFQWLMNLSKDTAPQGDYSHLDIDDIPTQKQFKILISMRYEYVGELDYWCSQKTYIPQLMKNRYFLKPLGIDQAFQIIDNLSYESDAISLKIKENAEVIINNIAMSSSTNEDEVPAIMLSLVCYILYEEWQYNEDYEFSSVNINEAIYNYYRDSLDKIKVTQEHRQVLENILISPQRTRLIIPIQDERLQRIGISQYLETNPNLVSSHLFKIESIDAGNAGNQYIAFVHDKLVEAIFNHREHDNNQIKESKIVKQKRYRYLLLLLLLSILSIGLFMLYESHLYSVNYSPTCQNTTEDKDIIITNDNVSEPHDWGHATRLINQVKMCSHRCDVYGNSFFRDGKDYYDINYAHNAENICFATYQFLPQSKNYLQFGENTQKVYLLQSYMVSDSCINWINCKNRGTIFYVPYGSTSLCLKNDAFRNVHFVEMSFVETIYRNLKFRISRAHLHLTFLEDDESIPTWIIVIIFWIALFCSIIRRSISTYFGRQRYWFVLLFSLLYFVVYIICEIYIGMHERQIDSEIFIKYYYYLPFTTTIICYYLMLFVYTRFNKNYIYDSVSAASNNFSFINILYGNVKTQKIALQAKQLIIESGAKENNIKLNLNIVKKGKFDKEIAIRDVQNTSINIVLISKEDIDQYWDYSSFWSVVEKTNGSLFSRKYVKPYIFGCDQDYIKQLGIKEKILTTGGGSIFEPVFFEHYQIDNISTFKESLGRKWPKSAKKGCITFVIIYIFLILMIYICDIIFG